MRNAVLFGACLLAGTLLASSIDAADQRGKPEWYLKTSLFVSEPASERIIQDTRSGVFGQLYASDRGADRHDLPAWSSTDNSEAAIVFEQDSSWGELSGEYLSDYRDADSKNERWLMTVKTRHVDADVLLSWQDIVFLVRDENGKYLESTTPGTTKEEKLNRRLRLIDLETGMLIRPFKKKYQKAGGYAFNMNGASVRYFRWVRGRTYAADYSKPENLENEATPQSLMAVQQSRAAEPVPAGRFGAPPSSGQSLGEQP